MGAIFVLLACISIIYGQHVHEIQIEEKHFSFKNCNKTAVPLYFRSFRVAPDPIQFGKAISVSMDIEVLEDIGNTSTLQADFNIQLKIGYEYSPVCDMVEEKYCHYEDICSFMRSKQINCPEKLTSQGFACQCPIKKNKYEVTKFPIPIPSMPVIITGEFDVTIQLKEKGIDVGCIDVHFCLGVCD